MHVWVWVWSFNTRTFLTLKLYFRSLKPTQLLIFFRNMILDLVKAELLASIALFNFSRNREWLELILLTLFETIDTWITINNFNINSLLVELQFLYRYLLANLGFNSARIFILQAEISSKIEISISDWVINFNLDWFVRRFLHHSRLFLPRIKHLISLLRLALQLWCLLSIRWHNVLRMKQRLLWCE